MPFPRLERHPSSPGAETLLKKTTSRCPVTLEALDSPIPLSQALPVAGMVEKLVRGTADFVRLARFFDEQADPWSRIEMKVDCHAFGLASEREFATYLEGPTRVPASSLEEVCEWLRGCEALDDQTLFFQQDYWQHPVTFEHLRKGDCEDHALWAWRQLVRLGFSGLFMAGLWRDVPHTWVFFVRGGIETVLESTAKTGSMLLPLDTARHFYCPALAVDNHGRTFVYQGYPRFRTAAGARRSDPETT